jgi:Cohesin domain/PEP-CTERM motif
MAELLHLRRAYRKEVRVRLQTLGLVALVCLCSRPALATPVLSVPATTNATQFDTFTVDVSIADAVDVIGFQFDLTYDETLLTVTDVTEGPFLGSGGAGTVFLPGDFTTTPGSITFTLGALSGLDPGINGGGVLAHIVFTPILPGASALTLSNALLQDSTFEVIEPELSSGRVVIAESTTAPQVPEPSTLMLIATGLAAAYRRRRANRAA